MGVGSYIKTYKQAVREAHRIHLQPLGFTLKKGESSALVAESQTCRIIFQPQSVLPLIQKLAGEDPVAARRAFDLAFVLNACGVEDEFQLAPIQGPDTVKSEVDRMVRLLLDECRAVIDGDEAAWNEVSRLAAEADEQALEQLAEVGVRLKEDGRWRDLPELEEVKIKGKHSRTAGTLALMFFVPSLILFPLTVVIGLALGESLPTKPADQIGLAVLVLIGLPLAMRLIREIRRAQYSWQTTPDGLTITGFRKKRLVRWDEIETVGVMPGAGYEFRTARDRVRLDKAALQDTAMEASIWQHLNRVGKTEDLILSDFAMSLWAEIPEEKTDSTQWESPIPAHLSDILLRFVAAEALIWGIAYRFGLDPIGVGIVVSWWPVAWLMPRLITIKRVSVDDDSLSAVTALGKRTVSWTGVQSVKFINPGIRQPASLQIRGRGLSFARIPWIPEHPNSTRVMLAILRRLRQQPRFRLLPFPTVLLTAGGSEGQG